MFCKYCGSEMPNDSLFCPRCGQPNEDSNESGELKRCQTCKKEFTGDRLFCDTCGGVLVQADAINSIDEPGQPHPHSLNPQGQDAMSSQGQTSYGSQVPPAGMAQSTQHSYSSNAPAKKKRVFLPLFLIFLFTALGVIAIAILSGDHTEKTPINTSGPSVSNTEPATTYEPEGGMIEPLKPAVNELKYQYSYTELPDVLSPDSDQRFTYYTDYIDEGIIEYEFLFNDDTATDSEFYQACADYSKRLMTEYGFYYEEEFSDQLYDQTGIYADYLSRDDYVIAIAAIIEDSLRYIYISIIPLDEEEQIVPEQQTSEIPNYSNYLAGRESKHFTFDETVNMDNGLSFSLHNVLISYNPNDTMTVELILDLGCHYQDFYFNNGEFMILPMDAEGYVIADAHPIAYVTDSNEYLVTMPFLVNTYTYDRLTFTYIIPMDTYTFTIYATNYIMGQSTPAYVMDVVYDTTQ